MMTPNSVYIHSFQLNYNLSTAPKPLKISSFQLPVAPALWGYQGLNILEGYCQRISSKEFPLLLAQTSAGGNSPFDSMGTHQERRQQGQAQDQDTTQNSQPGSLPGLYEDTHTELRAT